MPGSEYHRPGSVEEATALLARAGARPIAGGTDLMVQIRSGARRPRSLVDLTFVESLDEIVPTADGGLRIGAMVRLSRVASDPRCLPYPVLTEGAATVGSLQIRHQGTLVGNLCNGSPAADTAPALLVYEAVAQVVGRDGRRDVPLEEFWLGPGQTTLQPGEWVEAVALPPPAPHGGCYLKLGRTWGADLATVGVAAYAGRDGVRLAVAAVAPTPRRLRGVEKLFDAGSDVLPAAFPAALAAAIDPIDDARAGADYRRAMTVTLASRAWKTARERLAALEGRAR